MDQGNGRFKIKCRFCPWQTARWTTNSKGKRINGYYRLQNHVALVHWGEYDKLLKWVEEGIEEENA